MSVKFKTPLIENQKYYQYRMTTAIFGLFVMILAIFPNSQIDTFFENFNSTKIFFSTGFITLIILLIYYSTKIRNKFLKGNYIEIYEMEILLKNKKNELIEKINMDDVEEIFLTSNYHPYAKTFKEFLNEFIGNSSPKYMELKFKKDNTIRRFDFMLDSHYMESQIKKLVREWKLKKLKVNFENLGKTSQHCVT